MSRYVTLIITKDLIAKYQSEGRVVEITMSNALKMLNKGFKGPIMVTKDKRHLYMCPRTENYSVIYHCKINSKEEFETLFRTIVRCIFLRLSKVYSNVTVETFYEALRNSGLLSFGVSWLDKKLLVELKDWLKLPGKTPSKEFRQPPS